MVKATLPVNQIICGDVLKVMKNLPDNSIHFAVTSPPYNVGKNYDNHNDNTSLWLSPTSCKYTI